MVPAVTTEPTLVSEHEWDRLRQRYAYMRGRAVTLSLVAIGPVVEARTPDEMVERTHAAIIAATKDGVMN